MTLVEMLLAVAVLAIAWTMIVAGLRFLRGLSIQEHQISAKRDVQVALFTMAKNVRNARSILQVSSHTLILQTFNTQGGYDTNTNPNLFVNVSTLTFRYESEGGKGSLRKIHESNGLVFLDQKMLKGILRPDAIFTGIPPIPPYGAVEIRLTVAPSFSSRPRRYSNRAYLRSRQE